MEQFEVVLIGAGHMGKVHLQAALDSPYISKVHICDPSPEIIQQRREEFGVENITLDDALKNPRIPLAIIATPNDLHAAQTLQCLSAGKGVLCEKPMGMDLPEARQIAAAAGKPGAFLQIGFELHYSTMYQLAHQWIKSDLIGEVTQTQCRYFCCEFHKKNSWRSNSAGNFLIAEKLSHYLDLQRWYLNEEFESVYSLSAAKTVPYFNHNDNHQILARYPNGKVGVLNFIMYIAETFHNDPLKDMLEQQSDDGHALQYHICGLKGAIEIDVFRRRIRRWEFRDGEKQLESSIVETITYTPQEDQQSFHNVYGQTLRVLELFAQGKAPEVSAQDALQTMKLCQAADLSEQTGTLINAGDERLTQ